MDQPEPAVPLQDCSRTQFLEALLDDEEHGRLAAVDHYLERFPEIHAFVRAEYAALCGDADSRETGAVAMPSQVGRYEVRGVLGEGGMGRVYEAFDPQLRRKVVIKALHADLGDAVHGRERLRREARVLGQLAHPHLTRVIDLVELDGRSYLVIAFHEGRTLGDFLAQARQQSDASPVGKRWLSLGPQPTDTPTALRRLVTFFVQVANALYSAHLAGIVHRDLKPQNLMVSPDGSPVVLDFGLALPGSDERLTVAGELLGTPLYMAPEQIEGGAADARTDVYALGVTLYEALTLVHPFAGPGGRAATFHRILRGDPVPLRRHQPLMPRDLESVVLRAIERLPADRYPDMQAFGRDLQRVHDLEPTEARPVSGVGLVWRRLRRRPWIGLMCLVLVLLVVWTVRVEYLLGREVEIRASAKSALEVLLKVVKEGNVSLSEIEEVLDDEVQRFRRGPDKGLQLLFPRGNCLSAASLAFVPLPGTWPGSRVTVDYEYRIELLDDTESSVWSKTIHDVKEPVCEVVPDPVIIRPDVAYRWSVKVVGFTLEQLDESPEAKAEFQQLTDPIVRQKVLEAAASEERFRVVRNPDLQLLEGPVEQQLEQLVAHQYLGDALRLALKAGPRLRAEPGLSDHPRNVGAVPKRTSLIPELIHPTQQREPAGAVGAIAEFYEDIHDEPGRNGRLTAAAAERFVANYEHLHEQLSAQAASLPTADLGRAYRRLADAGDLLGRPRVELMALLEEARSRLLERPLPRHGLSGVLTMLSQFYYEIGRAPEIAADWLVLAKEWPQDPKRPWIACEAARYLTNVCRRPEAAVDVLDGAIGDLEVAGASEWSPAERAALRDDPELWIVDETNPHAASRQDCLGHVLLLRGFAQLQCGRLQRAIDDLGAARGHFNVTKNQLRLANIDHDLAGVWLQLGRFRLAFDAAGRALRYYESLLPEPDGNGVLAMHKVQALALLRLGSENAPAARQLLQGMGFLGEETAAGRNYPSHTNADVGLAWGEAFLAGAMPPADTQEIERLFAAVRGYAEPLGEWRVWVPMLHIEARWRLRQGRLADAKACLELAGRQMGDHRVLQVQQSVLEGMVDLAAGNPRRALDAFAKAGAGVNEAVAEERLWAFGNAVGGYQSLYSGALRGAVEAARQLRDSSGVPERAVLESVYRVVQQFHGYEAACSFAANSGLPALDGPLESSVVREAELRRQLEERESRITSLQLKEAAGPVSPVHLMLALNTNQGQLDATRSELDALRAMRVGTNAPQPADLGAVQRCLLPGEILVEYLDLGTRWVRLAIDATQVDIEGLGERSDLRLALAAGSQATPVGSEPGMPELAPIAAALLDGDAWLAEQLRNPGRAGNPRKTTLLVSAEGALARVPFAALPWQGKHLIDRLAIGYVASGTVLSQLRARAIVPPAVLKEGQLLALGNPVHDPIRIQRARERGALRGADLGRLPATADEVLGVAKCWASADELASLEIEQPASCSAVVSGARFQVRLGAEACESALTPAALQGVRFLHLACHGRADDDASAQSFLALSLASAPGAEDDGWLRLAELTQLRGDYELIALSACETGAGPIRGHEGPVSFARAAYAAGARRILATLHRVDDAAASQLVVRFYELWIRDGKTAAEALAIAQREAAARGVPMRDWAAFTLWGEPR